ncbi:MAG: hypothetical protein K2O82_08085, partial [Alistipes sp.]|nr:hypothetical protein [Alistipes sp.]
MKRTTLFLLALTGVWNLAGQPSARIHRTEILPYATRHDAEARNRAASGHAIDFRPEAGRGAESPALLEQRIEIPYVWTDGCVYLHIENAPAAYTLRINGRQ